MPSIPLSVLDLAPVCEGSEVGAALGNSLDLARHAEALGYRRFWLAEHHNMPGIASAATAVLIAHVAASRNAAASAGCARSQSSNSQSAAPARPAAACARAASRCVAS